MPQHSVARVRCVVSLLLALFLSAPPSRADAPATRPTTFAGEWQTSFGVMTLRQNGNAVEGQYLMNGIPCRIEGTLEGKTLNFRYTEPNAAGEGEFVLSADAGRFTGKWRPRGVAQWGRWEGVRKDQAPATDSFTGLWRASYGKMRLVQNGKQVSGVYDYAGGSTITGTVNGRTLKFTYDQPDGEKGEGTFTLSPDGMSFDGTWMPKAPARNAPVEAGPAAVPIGGKWSGQRILPQPGRNWLVILEAHWENDLEDEEYSFGQMLRTFFARVPSVKVRHRFFASEADFKRWCAELPYLAEPVYLHISSHGTHEGIVCDGRTIGVETIAESLKDVGNLRLLHFGSCLIAGGPIPKKLHQSLGSAATFPISGYGHAADWGGSAVVDFAYLDLVLARNISPASAVKQVRGMITFARDKGEAGDSIAPANLLVIEPPHR